MSMAIDLEKERCLADLKTPFIRITNERFSEIITALEEAKEIIERLAKATPDFAQGRTQTSIWMQKYFPKDNK